MEKAIEVIEYLENEFSLELSHLQKVDLEHILTKKTDSKELLLHDVVKPLPTNDVDEINGNFAQAERALLRIDPSGEEPDPTEIYELLQWFRDKLLSNDC